MGTKDKITLDIIYGIACTGKSTLALHLAQAKQIHTIIHTDYVREVQRACNVPANTGPLMKVTHTAWELFGACTDDHIIKGFTAQVHVMLPVLVAVAEKLSQDGCDAIIEGVHCYSEVLNHFAQVEGLVLLPQLLVVPYASRLLDRMQHKEEERSRAGEPKKWKNHLKILLTIQDFLLQDAAHHHIPIRNAEERS